MIRFIFCVWIIVANLAATPSFEWVLRTRNWLSIGYMLQGLYLTCLNMYHSNSIRLYLYWKICAQCFHQLHIYKWFMNMNLTHTHIYIYILMKLALPQFLSKGVPPCPLRDFVLHYPRPFGIETSIVIGHTNAVLVEMPGGRCATCRWKREVVYMCMYVLYIHICWIVIYIIYIYVYVCAMDEISSYWDIYILDTYVFR